MTDVIIPEYSDHVGDFRTWLRSILGSNVGPISTANSIIDDCKDCDFPCVWYRLVDGDGTNDCLCSEGGCGPDELMFVVEVIGRDTESPKVANIATHIWVKADENEGGLLCSTLVQCMEPLKTSDDHHTLVETAYSNAGSYYTRHMRILVSLV